MEATSLSFYSKKEEVEEEEDILYTSSIKVGQIFNKLDINSKFSSVIATLGPSCKDESTIMLMLDAGMDVARICVTQGDIKTNDNLMTSLKSSLMMRPGKSCPVMLDTIGPEIRTGLNKNSETIFVQANQKVKIWSSLEQLGDAQNLGCSLKTLPQLVLEGMMIGIDDGKLQCRVKEIEDDGISVICQNDHQLGENQIISFPNSDIRLPILTEDDEEQIKHFILNGAADFISASFTRTAEDVRTIRKFLAEDGQDVKIFAKIETVDAIQNLHDIIKESDGIIICRGNLGTFLPVEKVFLAQQYIIEEANKVGIPVIVSTELLESMLSKPRPTRAECTDIANAILNGADAVLLARECAEGSFPVETVSQASKIVVEAEQTIDHKQQFKTRLEDGPTLSITDTIGRAAA